MKNYEYHKNLTRYYLDDYFIDRWKIEDEKFIFELWHKLPQHNAVFLEYLSENEFINLMEDQK